MKIKKIFITLILAFILLQKIFSYEDTGIFFEEEMERFQIIGDFYEDSEKEIKYIAVIKGKEITVDLINNYSEDVSLWIKTRIYNPSDIIIKLNEQNVNISEESYYFKWIKIGNINKYEPMMLNIKNNNGNIELDKIAISKKDCQSFTNEYVINDIMAELISENQIKISFSGMNLINTDVSLYRQMTVESYTKYLNKKIYLASQSKLLYYISDLFVDPIEKIETVKIKDIDNYYIIDKNPLIDYRYEYFLKVENGFGESIESKRVMIEYKSDGTFNNVEKKVLNKSSTFERKEKFISEKNTIFTKTELYSKLYINKDDNIVSIPSFLENSFYFKGLRQTDNILFHTDKYTDVYIYTQYLDDLMKRYYFELGFSLIRSPERLTDSSNIENSYFFHKQYRPKTGDALYLFNSYKDYDSNKEFSLLVEDNDITIHFDSNKTILKKSNKIIIEIIDLKQNQILARKEMTEVKTDLWEYSLPYGATKFKDYKLGFNFINENDKRSENDLWAWDYYQYLKNYGMKSPNVVFVKESKVRNLDVNITNKNNSNYLGLEDYMIEDGDIYKNKAKGINYGFSYISPLIKKETPLPNNIYAIYNGNEITIEYTSIDSSLVDSENINIIYSYDQWETSYTLSMQSCGYKIWKSNITPDLLNDILSFKFESNEKYDDNNGRLWNWDYIKETTFNNGYERDLSKREYIELIPVDMDISELKEYQEHSWEIDVENGYYDIYFKIEKPDKEEEGIIEINNKTYYLPNDYKEIFNIRDRIIVFNNKIKIKNTGKSKINLFSNYIHRNVKDIKQEISNTNILKLGLLSNTIIDESFYKYNGDDVLKVDFNLTNLTNINNIELVFDAVSDRKNCLVISSKNDFDDDNLIVKIPLSNDFKTYRIDLTEYKNNISDDNIFSIYLKGAKGIKLATHRNEISPLLLYSTYTIDDDIENYQGLGKLSFRNNKYYFIDDHNAILESVSQDNNIENYLDTYCFVNGYIKDDILYIIQIIPIINIISIEGDKYTNKQITKWIVNTNIPTDSLKYRIKNLGNQWKVVSSSEITENIPIDGEYVLEIIPIKNNIYGSPFTFRFIIDRTGPEISVTESIPLYSSNATPEVYIDFYDNYTPSEEVMFFYDIIDRTNNEIISDGNRLILSNGNGTLVLPEGKIAIYIYGKDKLLNIGNNIYKELIVDLTPPVLEYTIQNTYKYEQRINKRYVSVNFVRDDNITPKNEITTYYMNSSNGIWYTTLEDYIDFELNDFVDGVYSFYAYNKDHGELTSDIIIKNFTVDTIPIDSPTFYNTRIIDNYLTITWETRENDPTFSHYLIRRSPEFPANNQPTITKNTVVSKNNNFTDKYGFFNPEYTYYVSVVDIYGNISNEFQCSSLRKEEVSGSIGEIKTLSFGDADISIKIEDEKPYKIGITKINIKLDEKIVNAYKLKSKKLYYLGPEGIQFKTPVTLSIKINDLTGDHDYKDKNYTLYYYNEKRNYWEEVASKYNKNTQRLESELYHFSTYGVGERNNNNSVSSSIINTSVSQIDGSINSAIDLANLESHQEDYSLKLLFNTQKYYQSSKLSMNEGVKNNIPSRLSLQEFWRMLEKVSNNTEKEIIKDSYYPDYDDIQIPMDFIFSMVNNENYESDIKFQWKGNNKNQLAQIINKYGYHYYKLESTFKVKFDVGKVLERRDQLGKEIRFGIEKWEDYHAIYPYPGTNDDDITVWKDQEIFDYSKTANKFNYLDNAWELNIPQLICDDPTSDNFKYIKFEDGSVIEITIQDGIFRNVMGKRFLFEKLYKNSQSNGYLVQTEFYKNYKFDVKGRIEYIFYSNNPNNDISQINLANNSFNTNIIFSFVYSGDFLSEIRSHDKTGEIVKKISFEYEQLNGDLNNSFVKRIKSIFKEANINGAYRKILELNLSYNPDTSEHSIGSSSYVVTYNQNDVKKNYITAIKLERLKSVNKIFLDYNGGSSTEKNMNIDYSYDGTLNLINWNANNSPTNIDSMTIPAQYIFVNYFNSVQRTVVEDINLDIIDNKNISLTIVDDIKEEYKKNYSGYDRSVYIEYNNKDYNNYGIRKLSNITITNDENISMYNMNLYQRTDNFYSLTSNTFGNCTKEVFYKKYGTESNNITYSYTYLINPDSYSLTPFSKINKSIQIKDLYIDNIDNTNITSRNISLLQNLLDNKYHFQEFSIDDFNSVIEKKQGTINHTISETSYITDPSMYFLVDPSYNKELNIIDGERRLIQQLKLINTGSGEKILTKDVSVYNLDKLIKKYSYINNTDTKLYEYIYIPQDQYYGDVTSDREKEEFLFPQVKEIREQVEEDIYKIQSNTFERSDITGNVRIQKSEKYLNSDSTKKLTVEYEYDNNDRVIKETEVIRNDEFKGLTKAYEYDELNNVTTIKVGGNTKGLTGDQITDKRLVKINKYYYNKATNNLIVEEEYEEGDNNCKNITLYFYSYDGEKYKTVRFSYIDNNGTSSAVAKAEVAISYSNKIIEGKEDFEVSGAYSRLEPSNYYNSYYNNIISLGYDFDFENTDYNNYKDEIESLNTLNFNFDNNSISFIEAKNVVSFMGQKLLEEEYRSNDKTEDERIITKRYATFKTDILGNIKTKTTDDNSGSQVYTWEYDDLGNMTRSVSPNEHYIPTKIFSAVYNDYSKDIVEIQNGVETLSRYNNYNCLIYLKTQSNDANNKIDYNEAYRYNLLGQMTYKRDKYEREHKFYYDYYGIIKTSVGNSLEGFPEILTSINKYNNIGKPIYTFSDIIIKSAPLNPDDTWIENNWQTKNIYDDFGNLVKTEIRMDTEILDEGITANNIIEEFVYDKNWNIIFKKSNKYNFNNITTDDNLTNEKFVYNYRKDIKSKIYYGWDPVNKNLVPYADSYIYDDYGRLVEQELKKSNGIVETVLSRQLICDYDQHNNVKLAFSKERGKNWVRVDNSYNTFGNLTNSTKKVIDVTSDNESKENLLVVTDYLIKQDNYILYDEFQRKSAEVSDGKTAKYYEYENGLLKREYSGINAPYSIVNNNVEIGTPGTPIEYFYNSAGMQISEIVKNGSGEVISEKYFGYDNKGRIISESMSRYDNNNIQKETTYHYDGLNRLIKTVADDYIEEICQWENVTDSSNSPKIIDITINKGAVTYSYQNIIKYSKYGNILESIDKDKYKSITKYDNFGNILKGLKKKIGNVDEAELVETVAIYDETGLFLNSSTVNSKGTLYTRNCRKIDYIYNNDGNVTNIKGYDIINSNILTSEKSFVYNQDNQLSSVTNKIDGIDYTIGYIYNEIGAVEKKIYPDGKEYIINFGTDGAVDNIKFDGTDIVKNINNVVNNPGIINDYQNGSGMKTSFTYDSLNRIRTKTFDNLNQKSIMQRYSYDKSGNIIGVEELQPGATESLVETMFNKNYYYDEYNRLIRSVINGKFKQEVDAKLTFKEYDRKPGINDIDYNLLEDDGDNQMNLEYGSASVLISDKYGNENVEFSPEVIRILKQSNSKLKVNMVNFYYKTDNGFEYIGDDRYDIDYLENGSFLELKNFKDEILSNILKINFDLDNTNIDNEALIDQSLNKELKDQIKFYTEVDTIDQEYTYDVMGNRLSELKSLGKDGGNFILDEKSDEYVYDSEKRLLLSDNNYNYIYDDNGFLTHKTDINNSDNYWVYTWDSEGNLRKIEKYEDGIVTFAEEYFYDDEGTRIRKVNGAVTTIYIYEGLELIYEKEIRTDETKYKNYIYGLNTLQAVFEYDGVGENTGSSYHYCDIQNSTRFITDSLKNIVQENIFDPFGQELITTENPTGGSLDYKYATHSGVDKNTGLTYMTARWMDNVTGRFISPDVMKQGLNYYVYCGNNPTTMIDPDGNWFGIDDLIVSIIGATNGKMNETFQAYYGTTGNFLLAATGLSPIIGGITGGINAMQISGQDKFWEGFFYGFNGGVLNTLTLGIPSTIHGAEAGWYNIYSDGLAYLSDATNMFVTIPGLYWGAQAMSNGGSLSRYLSEGSNMFYYTGVDSNFLAQWQGSQNYNFNDGTRPGFVIGNTYISGFTDDQIKNIMEYNFDNSKHKDDIDKLKIRQLEINNDSALSSTEKTKLQTEINNKISVIKKDAIKMVEHKQVWNLNWKKHEYSHVIQVRAYGLYFYANYMYYKNAYPNNFHDHSPWELYAHPMDNIDNSAPEIKNINNY